MTNHLDTQGLTEEQIFLQGAAFDFAESVLKPNAGDWDREAHFPVEEMRQAAELGFASIYACEEAGGSELGRLEASLIFEALAYGCPSTSAYLTIHNMVNWMIGECGNDAQREHWCQRLSTMEVKYFHPHLLKK